MSFQGFGMLHDVAVSRDGRSLYTGEITPSRVIRFTISGTGTDPIVPSTGNLVVDPANNIGIF